VVWRATESPADEVRTAVVYVTLVINSSTGALRDPDYDSSRCLPWAVTKGARFRDANLL
jgi:hypothetical protein